MHYAGKTRAGNPVRFPDRHPVFREGYGLSRFEEGIGLLVPEEARLQFDIGAIVVGERLAPIKSVRVNPPRPDFFSRKLLIKCKMRCSCVGPRIPNADEVFAASMTKQ